MAHYEPPHQDLRCLQIQLFSSLVVKELRGYGETVAPQFEGVLLLFVVVVVDVVLFCYDLTF